MASQSGSNKRRELTPVGWRLRHDVGALPLADSRYRRHPELVLSPRNQVVNGRRRNRRLPVELGVRPPVRRGFSVKRG